MARFSFFLQLFMMGYHKIAKKTELSSTVMFSDIHDLNITHDGYTDTTAELEQLLTDRYLLQRKSVEGFDQRYPLENIDVQTMGQIALNFYKYELLKKLTDNTVSEVDKLEYVEEYEKENGVSNSKYMPELFKGLLFSDW
jgi:hypothetical protein